MDSGTKKIIKYTALISCVILLIILCILLVRLNIANKEQIQITPIKEEFTQFKMPAPKVIHPQKSIIQEEIEKEVKPLMRDENDMPKSDVNVPEIG